jgi:hypothetical protein
MVSTEGCDHARVLQGLINAALVNMGITLTFARELLDNSLYLDLHDGCLDEWDFDQVHGAGALQGLIDKIRNESWTSDTPE